MPSRDERMMREIQRACVARRDEAVRIITIKNRWAVIVKNLESDPALAAQEYSEGITRLEFASKQLSAAQLEVDRLKAEVHNIETEIRRKWESRDLN